MSSVYTKLQHDEKMTLLNKFFDELNKFVLKRSPHISTDKYTEKIEMAIIDLAIGSGLIDFNMRVIRIEFADLVEVLVGDKYYLNDELTDLKDVYKKRTSTQFTEKNIEEMIEEVKLGDQIMNKIESMKTKNKY